MAFPDSNSTNQPEVDSRFFIRLAIRESKETDEKVLRVHSRLRQEAERFLEPESKEPVNEIRNRQSFNFLKKIYISDVQFDLVKASLRNRVFSASS